MNGDQELIDVNRADEEMLANLLGVGDVLARRIVEYRETVHPFEEVIELAAVPGISERMVRAWADRVTVGQIAAGVDAELLSAEVEELAPPALPAEPETTGEAVPAPAPILEPDAEEAELDVDIVTPEAAIALPEEVEAHQELDEPVPEAAMHALGEAASDMEEPAALPDAFEPIVEAETGEPDLFEEEQVPEAEEPVDVRLVEPSLAVESTQAEPDLEAVAPLSGAPSTREAEPPERGPAAATKRETPRRAAPGWFILIAGAVLGLLLSMAALLLLNRTLVFADRESQREAVRAGEALSDDLSGARRELGFVSATADALAVDVAVQATQAADLSSLAERTAAEQESLSGMVARNGHAVSTLEAQTAQLEAQFEALADVAEKVELFLQGMRDLLFELEGAPEPTATATPSPTVTATPTPAAKPETTATLAPGETAPATLAPEQTLPPGTMATRTPLPTATPFRGTATPLPNP